MHIVYVTHANGAKQREVFWNLGAAFEFCSDLAEFGYTQNESGEGFSRWSAA